MTFAGLIAVAGHTLALNLPETVLLVISIEVISTVPSGFEMQRLEMKDDEGATRRFTFPTAIFFKS
jgi:hypothetical protein